MVAYRRQVLVLLPPVRLGRQVGKDAVIRRSDDSTWCRRWWCIRGRRSPLSRGTPLTILSVLRRFGRACACACATATATAAAAAAIARSLRLCLCLRLGVPPHQALPVVGFVVRVRLVTPVERIREGLLCLVPQGVIVEEPSRLRRRGTGVEGRWRRGGDGLGVGRARE